MAEHHDVISTGTGGGTLAHTPADQGADSAGCAGIGERASRRWAKAAALNLLSHSGAYVVMAAVPASSFGEKLTHTDVLYFTVTVFVTVGFGGHDQVRGGTAFGHRADGRRSELDALEATGRTGELTDQQARELLGAAERRGNEKYLTTDEVRRRLGLQR
jgi:hypothetical protein